MNALKHKLKINNSYESSSGSGSSLGEQHDSLAIDEENLHLPTLLRPANVVDSPPAALSPSSKSPKNTAPKEPSLVSIKKSAFEGFSDSPFNQLKLERFAPALEQQSIPTSKDASPGQIVFKKFYDTIVEESSCNAVDLQLSNRNCVQQPQPSSSKKCDSDNLNFDGKIESLKLSCELSGVCNEQEVEATKQAEAKSEEELNTTMSTLDQLTQSFLYKRYSNERSPDLFADEEDQNENDNVAAEVTHIVSTPDNKNTQQAEVDVVLEACIKCPTESSFAKSEEQLTVKTNTAHTDQQTLLLRENCRREKELLRRIRKCLAGVPPPPAFTIPQINICTEVLLKKDEILNFFVKKEDEQTLHALPQTPTNTITSLFKPTHTLDSVRSMAWKDILGVRQHGLSFNLNLASESNEYLGLSVIERFVGAETASSYRNSPTSVKKRAARLKFLTQSPGNRLSHLARRRAVFSSANLATNNLQKANKLGPQILLDKKKNKHRRKNTPKRKTPGSKRKTRQTPSTSARKRLFRNDLSKPAPSRETSKRALFQSPAKQMEQINAPKLPPINREIANRIEKSKRALFSPDKFSDNSNSALFLNTHFDAILKRKRNPADDDDDDPMGLSSQSSNKLFRGSVANLTPRALKIKSQSFCSGSGSIHSSTSTSSMSTIAACSTAASAWNLSSNSSQSLAGAKLQRAHTTTDTTTSMQTNSLTENQRKKLLWAVSQALQEKKITAKHESFKQYAAVLARVVRRIFQEYYHKCSTSNSETMLRLSKKYAFNVVAGKGADDIYLQAKAQIDELKRQSSSRLSGYIGPEEYKLRTNAQLLHQSQQSLQTNMSGSLQSLYTGENSIETYNIGSSSAVISPMCSSGFGTQSSTSSFQRYNSNEMLLQTKSITKQLPIQANLALRNSSSKNNLSGLALRENIDCEQRRSGQKNFTGKDQRNVSPYAKTAASHLDSAVKVLQATQFCTELLMSNGAKAKRQITFES